MFKAILMSAAVFCAVSASAADPIKALLVTGGCCHDYKGQAEMLTKGIAKYANIEFEVVNEGKGTDHVHSPFKKENWSKGYDVVIHNQCSAKLGDEWGDKVAKEHYESGVPAVAIHCAFHTYRDARSNEWRKLLGATSKRHGAMVPVTVTFDKPDHPILKGIKPFTTNKEELYVITKVWENATVLATGAQGNTTYPLAFITEYGKSKAFTITLGHQNHTFTIPEWMEMVSRGVLWAADKINEDGSAKEGYGPVAK